MNKKSTLSKAESNYLTHTKKEKGITLIALVVTIVVLITLATVSINTVLGQNGIISKAKQAKEIYSNTIAQEDEEMKVLLNELNKIKEKNSLKEIQSDTLLKNYIYNGKEQKWVPTVTDENGTKLIKDKDYTVEYSSTNFIDAGDIIVRVKGCGNYTGTIIKKYTIEKANLTITTPSVTKEFNGLPISLEGLKATVEGLVNGETISITLTGDQAEVGWSYCGYIINENESTAKLKNYNIIEKLGILTVERRHITITP